MVDPPGRPIVAGTGSIFSNISIFWDRLLRQYAVSARSYIRDTGDFLDKISGITLPDGCLMASFDVTSLYTSIDHTRGVSAVRRQLSGSEYSLDCQDFIVQLLDLVLKNNYFLFMESFLLQLRGTAMGSNVAPTYANVFMAVLEEDLVYVSHHFSHVLGWWRYIDDVFLIWNGDSTSLESFHNFKLDPEIAFTLTYSDTHVQFLDTTVSVVGDKLSTDIFTKPTDCNTLLHYNSCHPRSTIDSLPYSQLLRVKRVVQDAEMLPTRYAQMVRKFRERGYPHQVIDKHLNKVRGTQQVLPGITHNKVERIPFISTYLEQSGIVAKIIRKHWSILKSNLLNIAAFTVPPLFSYKRTTNFRDKLVRADIPAKGLIQTYIGPRRKGCYPCLGCVNCSYMIKGDRFIHPVTGTHYDIGHYLTCDSSYVVYVLSCMLGRPHVT
ncbi:uncharacterized protein LOC122923195 [Bufo gargarizans]|uniref:uncharacterized protein LOC122923195 n=1 Tax=Bufo gargarizans TaxID=30331 RepID=UPI001CF14FCA|nr:uncharacterized protein LOC122923195 [Bufo gargarizans]